MTDRQLVITAALCGAMVPVLLAAYWKARRHHEFWAIISAVLALLSLAAALIQVAAALSPTPSANPGPSDAPRPVPSATVSPTTHDDQKCHPGGSNPSYPYLCPVSWGKDGNIPVYAATKNGTPIAKLGKTSGSEEQLFRCQKRGDSFPYKGSENLWWAYTRADIPSVSGWVPEVYLAGGWDNEPDGGLPPC
jgi:hypothetical protein